MKLDYTERFIKSLEGRSRPHPEGFLQAVASVAPKLAPFFLAREKYDEAHDIWQARVTRDWRFYVQIVGDTRRTLASYGLRGLALSVTGQGTRLLTSSTR